MLLFFCLFWRYLKRMEVFGIKLVFHKALKDGIIAKKNYCFLFVCFLFCLCKFIVSFYDLSLTRLCKNSVIQFITICMRHIWLVIWRSWIRAHQRPPLFLQQEKKLNSYCLVLVDFRNRFEHDFTIKLK